MSLAAPLLRVHRHESQLRDDVLRRHVRQYAALLQRASDSDVLTFEHYVIFPRVGQDQADNLADMLAGGMGLRHERIADLPPLLPTRYQPTLFGLAPEAGNYPLVTTLLSWDMAGVWNWDVLPAVMTVGFPIDICVAIKSHTGTKAYGALDRVQTLLHGMASQFGNKAALTKMSTDYATLLDAVRSGEALHQVGLAIMVRGRTEKELHEREQQVSAKLAGRASITRLNGLHEDTFRAYFTSANAPEPKIELQHNMTSAGVAVTLGALGMRRRAYTEGVYWGLSGQTPFFWDGFDPNLDQPNHGVILGTTGSGKTFSSSVLLLREMDLMGTQVVMLDPLGNCRRMVEALGPGRASHNVLSLNTLRLNPVERIYDDLAEQSDHLSVVMGLLLGRSMTQEEIIAMEMTARLVYSGIEPGTLPANQPRIEDVTRVLKGIGGDPWLREAAGKLGSLLDAKYVQGPKSVIFNTPTLTDWRLEKDLIAFNFRNIPESEGMRRLLYYLVLSTIHREAHKEARTRRRIVMVDEFRVMSTEPTLARQVSVMFKTFRTLGVGVWAAEQDIITFTGLDQAQMGSSNVDVMAGRQILSNSTFILSLALQPAGARDMPKQFPQITDSHLRYLTALNPKRNPNDRGRGLIVLSDEVYPLRISPTQYEMQILGGS
jgi:hypothetical protein